MAALYALALAVLQGFTELFPISSLGHAVIVPPLFGWPVDQHSPDFLPFVVVLHVGTATALLLYFWRDWLFIAAGLTGKTINIKKGQFVAPPDMKYAVAKVRDSGNERVSLCERGASFGYNNLVVDMRALPIMREFAPVVFDGTHSVQTPSAANGVSGGQPEFIPVLARAALAAGIDGVFLEVHDNPATAKSDGANALHLDKLKGVLEELLRVHGAGKEPAQHWRY